MLVQFRNLGKYGIVSDIDSYLLPPEAWSNGNNITFKNNHVEKSTGYSSFFTPVTTDTNFIVPVLKWTLGVPQQVWVYAGTDEVYKYDGTSSTEITRTSSDYTMSASDRWNATICQNIMYMNNGVDAPQMWDGDELEDLPYDAGGTWADESAKTKVLRNYKEFLVALQVNDDPTMVWWSHPAEPFSYPETWVETDSGSLAGKQQLTSTSGWIVDGMSLRDSFIIYKDDAIVNMSYVGGNQVHGFRDISRTSGLFAQKCVAEFFGKHFVVTNGDIIVHDGLNIESIVTNKVKRQIFGAINSDFYEKAYVVPFLARNEIWFCYPTSSSVTGYPNRVAIWNLKEGTWSFKDITEMAFMNEGTLFPVTVAAQLWSQDTQTWNQDETSWNEGIYDPINRGIIGISNTAAYSLDTGYTNAGTSYESWVERTGIAFGNVTDSKMITAVYPKGEGEMDIWVGGAWNQVDEYTWKGPFRINPSTDAQIRCRVNGRYHAIRFKFVGDSFHHLDGYDLEFVNTGYGR